MYLIGRANPAWGSATETETPLTTHNSQPGGREGVDGDGNSHAESDSLLY